MIKTKIDKVKSPNRPIFPKNCKKSIYQNIGKIQYRSLCQWNIISIIFSVEFMQGFKS